ncbi:hypothetical protein EVAR_39524_1 [Eumeta japonica]|uniref:Uncharacterized protein n=1 Tax=Eumeta variegata TaxID=151549 RepID=A0A4C1XL42_EUMVA|nr:hypothetical protein EVAR_39524_1 [Eumeta japonica]
MTEYVKHPCPPSTPHAPQTPILRTKESSAYIRTAPTPWPLSWCSTLDQDVERFMAISDGENPQNLARVISEITGKAREHLSVHPHDGTWNGVKTLLLEKCEDSRTVDMIQANIQQMRRHSTYAELLERIQRELYLIRGKYVKLNPNINENQMKTIMKIYENTARMTVLQMLPDHLSYLYETTGGLDSFREIIIKLELHGKLSSRKQILNTSKLTPTQNHFKGTTPHYQPHWSRNVPNQQQWPQHFKTQQRAPKLINTYDTDVMRSRSTRNTGKGPLINIGKGRAVRELFNHELRHDDNVIDDSEGNAYQRICEPYTTQDAPSENDEDSEEECDENFYNGTEENDNK